MARANFRNSPNVSPGILSLLRPVRKSKVWATAAKWRRPLLPRPSANARNRTGPMDSEPLPPLATYEDLAGMIDHSLVSPELNHANVVDGLELAKRYRVASAIVRPCDIDVAVRTLQGSG